MDPQRFHDSSAGRPLQIGRGKAAYNDVQERFDVSHPTAIKALRRLESMQILRETTGRERNQRFAADALLQILQA